MKRFYYLCTVKHMGRLNGLKRLVLLAAFVAPALGLWAQHQGVGIDFTDATLHVHSFSQCTTTVLPTPHPDDGRGTLEDPVGPSIIDLQGQIDELKCNK